MNALLSTRSLRKSYGDLDAVRGVDLDVEAGEIVGLLGANGAGKTTFMRCALGILAPSGGTSLLFGRPPSRLGRARIGYVPQGRGLYPDLTPRENAQFSAAAYGVRAGTDGSALAEGSPVDSYPRRLVRELPLGLQRRVAFDIALPHGPQLLVLDEPTSGVGPLESAELWEVIGRQAAAGIGVLVTTHTMNEAIQCDRLAVMVDGSIAAEGTEADIIAGATVVTVEAADWQAAFDRLVQAGLLVSLAGRGVRVLGAAPEQVLTALGGLPAAIGEAPVTLDERMALLAQ